MNFVLALKTGEELGRDRNFGHYGEKQLLAESGETQFLDDHRTGQTKSMWALLRGRLAVRAEQELGQKHREKAF